MSVLLYKQTAILKTVTFNLREGRGPHIAKTTIAHNIQILIAVDSKLISTRFWLMSSCLKRSSTDWLSFSQAWGRGMASERSCSVTMCNSRVVPQFWHARLYASDTDDVLTHLCAVRGCMGRKIEVEVKVAPVARAMPVIP